MKGRVSAGTGAGGGIIFDGGIKSSFTTANTITLGASGPIGTAVDTVDAFDVMEVIASASGLTFTLPDPEDTAHAHRFTVLNAGSESFTMYGNVLSSASFGTAAGDFYWSPTLATWVYV